MPKPQKQEITHEIIESPYRISWTRLVKFLLPPLFLILVVALWFVYFYIPSSMDPNNPNTFTPEIKTASPSGEKNRTINISKILSNPKEYSNKEICIRGYYYQAFESSALLDSFDYQEKKIDNYSTWVVNETGKDIIEENVGSEAVRDIVACGLFETGTNYGLLGSYQNQLTLESFITKGKPIILVPLEK